MAALPVKDVLVVGFGAVGAVFSLVLKRSGHVKLTAVARSNYEDIKNHGVHFKSGKYGELTGWRPDRLVRSVSEALDRPYSYVFLTTKTIPDVVKTPQILEPLLSKPFTDEYPQPTYVLIQNGLNVENDLYQAITKIGGGRPKIISSALWIGTNLLSPTVVEHGDFDRITLGMYRPNDYTTTVNSPEEAAILDDVGDILKAGGSTVTIVPEIFRVKFNKNLWNLAFSSFATLTGYALPAMFREPPQDPSIPYSPFRWPATAELIDTYTLPNIRAGLMEMITLARAMGFTDSPDGLPTSVVDNLLASVAAMNGKPNSTHKPSMLLDVERGQPIEVESIFGEVVRLARAYNVDAPRVETLYALLLVIQNQILRSIASR